MPEESTTQPLTEPAVGRAIRLRRLAVRAATAVGPESRPTPLSVVLMAQWLGLFTGLLDLVILLVRNHFFGTAAIGALQLNRHFPWMIPVTHLLIFSVAGLARRPWHCSGRDSSRGSRHSCLAPCRSSACS